MSPDERRELSKVLDVLKRASAFHQHRDVMNSNTHLAEHTRYSPLTSALETAEETLERLIGAGDV